MAPCPEWCQEGFHPWEPDADEYRLEHQSDNLASAGAGYTLQLYRLDLWFDGRLQVCEPAVILNGEALTVESAGLLTVDLTQALS